MSWATGPWGSTPWGGGTPSVNGAVQIIHVDYITPTLLRVDLTTTVVVNTLYNTVSNYTVAVRSDSPVAGDPVEVRRVLPPTQDVVIADYVFLETSPHTNGADYTITVGQLYTLDGTPTAGALSASYAARVTKTMKMLKSLPSHFDKRVDSLIHSLISAISIQDDKIGGSRSDEFT